MDRYDGKPFLRLLDCYVLQAIGKLDTAQMVALTQIEPKLSQIYGVKGPWQEIVANQMDFPANLSDEIEQTWEAGRLRAADQGLEVDPGEFARQFVDANFPH
ncbi:hypothetical protein Sphch_1586 [Sphingobium chlorophenolicum L-1]|uniref:Uncharacterized protein n=1 Tax=Sphingobium chlorophenolicum L-1 TaxID=690566 RepID=F6EZ33_SPHCR|nr:hypothetical protein [Sphingobium chlorophenolicum]AEG49274.1 hypothetical protein Sphch_1586 [Sphingobium chlorophenolicum L-1]